MKLHSDLSADVLLAFPFLLILLILLAVSTLLATPASPTEMKYSISFVCRSLQYR